MPKCVNPGKTQNHFNMKRILFMMFVVTAALSSCNKDKTTDPAADQSSGNALPLKAVTYVTNNYPDATIDYYVAVTNGSADYLVTLNTTEELAFTKSGDFLGKGEYFHGGSHGDTIHCDSIPGGGGHGGGHHGEGIPIDSLPALLKDYVTANYSGYLIRHAEFDSICFNGLVIETMLFQAGSEPVKLYFETTGNFLMRSDRILFTDVPQAVKDFISANYAGYTATDRAEKLTLATGSLEYVVYVHMGPAQKSVRVDANGALICEQSGFHHGCPGGGHGGPGGGGPGPGGHHGGIPIDSLPASIISYVTANYSGYTIRHAEYDSLCVNGLVFEVAISQVGFAPPVNLYFDMSGVFLMQANGIPYPDLPQSVKNYITTNYAGYFVCEIPQKLTLADGTLQYVVDLRKGPSRKSVRIDANGVLVCER